MSFHSNNTCFSPSKSLFDRIPEYSQIINDLSKDIHCFKNNYIVITIESYLLFNLIR